MKRWLAFTCLGCGWLTSSTFGQAPDAQPVGSAGSAAGASQAAGSQSAQPQTNAVYRDPRTGQLYQQELQTVEQPVTTWQRKLVSRTVVTPQTVIENQQVPQTYYVAKTEYVLQSKLKGWWNPLAQPTYAYEYVPVTRWVPQTQMVTKQVSTVKMLATQEQVPVDEPVQTTQKVTQVVMRPLAPGGTVGGQAALPAGAITTEAYASNGRVAVGVPSYQRPAAMGQPYIAPRGGYGYASNVYGASNSQPLVASVPILGRQPSQTVQPGALLKAPLTGLRDIVRATTAPFNGQSTYSSYAQPMNIATAPNANWNRDFNQAGMPATVVR